VYQATHVAQWRETLKSGSVCLCLWDTAFLYLCLSNRPFVLRFVDGRVVDCRNCSRSGTSIDSDLCSHKAEVEPDADLKFIVVIEKKCVYTRVCEDKLWNLISCLVVSTQGHPDLLTRLFLNKISQKTQATLVLLTDWEMSGLQMYLTYRLGSTWILYQNPELTTDIKWLGLRSVHVERYVV
jgi:DNA topoisomerase VI subunit A